MLTATLPYIMRDTRLGETDCLNNFRPNAGVDRQAFTATDLSIDFTNRTGHGTNQRIWREDPVLMALSGLDKRSVDRLARLYVRAVGSRLRRDGAQEEPRHETSRADADLRANMAVLAELLNIFATDDLASRAIVDALLHVKQRANEIETQNGLLSHMPPAGHG